MYLNQFCKHMNCMLSSVSLLRRLSCPTEFLSIFRSKNYKKNSTQSRYLLNEHGIRRRDIYAFFYHFPPPPIHCARNTCFRWVEVAGNTDIISQHYILIFRRILQWVDLNQNLHWSFHNYDLVPTWNVYLRIAKNTTTLLVARFDTYQ